MTLVLLAAATPAAPLDWGGIVPGTTTMEGVRSSYGPPSRTTRQQVEGFDTQEWTYLGERAPAGIRTLVVEFGLKLSGGFRPDLVRALRLEPKPGVFTRATILTGWGEPRFVHVEGTLPTRFFYPEGLVVDFAKDGWTPVLMTFTPPQPPPPGAVAPPR
jgi:hypothetical protein